MIASATRAAGSLDIVLTMTMPTGATSLVSVGPTASRFSAFSAGTVAGGLALDATNPIVVSGNRITLRLAADPGAAALDVYAFIHPDPSAATPDQNIIYDDHVDGDGISVGRHVQPTITGVVAPVPSRRSPSTDLGILLAFGQRRNLIRCLPLCVQGILPKAAELRTRTTTSIRTPGSVGRLVST